MKRLAIFISLHLFLFLLVIAYQAQALDQVSEEEWTIDSYETLAYARVSGNNKYEIEIVDGLEFDSKKFFDIRKNSWKLDRLVPSVLEATKLCKELSHKKL